MHKIFELTAKYIPARRKASKITLSNQELESHIQRIIFLIEMRGDKYFNYSKVLNELIETQGFPDRKNSEEMKIFKKSFFSISQRYELYPNHVSNYTFKLKTKADQPLFTFKRLIP